VLALGASKPLPVEVRVCAATCRDVHAQVAEGRFREDLYFRIGRPEVTLPPLRDRAEEIPWLIAAELARVDRTLSAAPAFVEACILRPWPGNVRELLREVRRAAHAALTEGRAQIEIRDLDPRAGVDAGRAPPAQALLRPERPPRRRPPPRPTRGRRACRNARRSRRPCGGSTERDSRCARSGAAPEPAPSLAGQTPRRPHAVRVGRLGRHGRLIETRTCYAARVMPTRKPSRPLLRNCATTMVRLGAPEPGRCPAWATP
jgi:hypothetical protein